MGEWSRDLDRAERTLPGFLCFDGGGIFLDRVVESNQLKKFKNLVKKIGSRNRSQHLTLETLETRETS